MAEYQLLRDRLPASIGEPALAHQPAYIQAISTGTIEARADAGDRPALWSEAMVDRARRSVGATIAAARVALRAGGRENGRRHAPRGQRKGSGFCVFNAMRPWPPCGGWRRHWPGSNGASRPGWSSTWPEPTRTRAAGSVRLELGFGGLQARDRRVFDWAWQRRIPLAMCMAGGYGTRIEDTVQVQVNRFAIAGEYWRRWQNLRP